ncbi:MAG: class I SAM-dependent rRNA methyltransferase [Desulfitobacteriaceae bacterium]|nr:class I SAM-dependent rRNA methyltransferase [Desulfitobacteriaceae bacterium]
MLKVYLKKQRKKRLEQGHPWIYQSEIERIEGDVGEDDLISIHNHEGYFLAQGFYNPQSQIAVRVLDYREDTTIDEAWFLNRIRAAWDRRLWLIPGVTSCRAVYGEADFLPGLIVDKYEDVLVIQMLAAGMEKRREWIFQALREVFQPRGIYERNDVPVRRLEGLDERSGFVGPEFDTLVEIQENGLKILVDVAEGQKTGYFFDQRQNRAALKPFMTGWGKRRGIRLGTDGQPLDVNGKAIKNPFWDGAEVLDCFSHTGGFMLHACAYGAKKVTCVDVSETALKTARENALTNGFLHRAEFVEGNAFDYLREKVKEGKHWDVVILDPPAFAKSHQALSAAMRGYKEINLQGMKLVRPGGILVSASCSYHLTVEQFFEMLAEAARDARKVLRLLELRRAGLDHPVLLGSRETDYLKFAIFEVFDRV